MLQESHTLGGEEELSRAESLGVDKELRGKSPDPEVRYLPGFHIPIRHKSKNFLGLLLSPSIYPESSPLPSSLRILTGLPEGLWQPSCPTSYKPPLKCLLSNTTRLINWPHRQAISRPTAPQAHACLVSHLLCHTSHLPVLY